jgi:hypothetical protein
MNTHVFAAFEQLCLVLVIVCYQSRLYVVYTLTTAVATRVCVVAPVCARTFPTLHLYDTMRFHLRVQKWAHCFVSVSVCLLRMYTGRPTHSRVRMRTNGYHDLYAAAQF